MGKELSIFFSEIREISNGIFFIVPNLFLRESTFWWAKLNFSNILKSRKENKRISCFQKNQKGFVKTLEKDKTQKGSMPENLWNFREVYGCGKNDARYDRDEGGKWIKTKLNKRWMSWKNLLLRMKSALKLLQRRKTERLPAQTAYKTSSGGNLSQRKELWQGHIKN